MIKKFLLRGITLIFIVTLILASLSSIFVKPGHSIKLPEGLYNQEASYDVLLLGSSHMNGLIDPEVLFDKYGITSFNYGTGGQPIGVTYYLLKEALKIHSDVKVAVLDVYYLGMQDNYGEEGYIRSVLDNMRFSLNKLEAIKNCTPIDELAYYIFPILKYHNRWGSLTVDDYNKNYISSSSITGFDAGSEKYGFEILKDQHSDEIGEIPFKNEEYLYKFIELSKTYGFELVFINAPYDYSSNDTDNWYTDDAAMYNKVQEIADDNDIAFINYSLEEKMNEINFDFKEDMNNVGHTNIWGANKVSLDLAKFLNNNYNLMNHRE